MTDPLFLRFPPPQLETKESFFSNRAFVRVCVCVCALCFVCACVYVCVCVWHVCVLTTNSKWDEEGRSSKS